MKGDNMTAKGRRKRLRETGTWNGKRSEEAQAKGEGRRKGDPTTYYRHRDAQWAQAARKMARSNWPIRKIAKRLGVSPDDVNRVL